MANRIKEDTIFSMSRIAEIDLARGVGVILMMFYHFVYDLEFLGMVEISLGGPPWVVIARITQIIFIITTGMTFAFSSGNLRRRFKHIGILFALAMVISFVTWLFFKDQAVKFGILHFFAVALLFTIPLRKLGVWNSLLGIFIIGIGFFLDKINGPFWLFPLGIHAPTFASLDYFPLIPWYGLFLQGVAFGALLRNSKMMAERHYRPLFRMQFLEKIGRKSLAFYLVHQPVLVGLLLLIRAIF